MGLTCPRHESGLEELIGRRNVDRHVTRGTALEDGLAPARVGALAVDSDHEKTAAR